jgi:hypothetical protein
MDYYPLANEVAKGYSTATVRPVQNTVATSLLLVFDYHVKKYINLVLPMPRLFTKK